MDEYLLLNLAQTVLKACMFPSDQVSGKWHGSRQSQLISSQIDPSSGGLGLTVSNPCPAVLLIESINCLYMLIKPELLFIDHS